jgi:hypothetical protein
MQLQLRKNPLPPRQALNDWMLETPVIGPWAAEFYRSYVRIEDQDELTKHLLEVRQLAWSVYKYRCIASFFFVNYNLREVYGQEWYEGLLGRLRGGGKLLDLGCAFGHSARNLVFDGAPGENILCGDLREEFWELGYKLFKDQDTFTAKFYQGDVFDPAYLEEFNGKVEIVHASAFFHLFDYPHQQKIVRRLTGLASKPGSIIFGRQVGNTIPCYIQNPVRPKQGLYQHDEESFRHLFETTAPGKWAVNVWLTPRKDRKADNGGYMGRLRFIITRL